MKTAIRHATPAATNPRRRFPDVTSKFPPFKVRLTEYTRHSRAVFPLGIHPRRESAHSREVRWSFRLTSQSTDPQEGPCLSNELDLYFRELARALEEVKCTGPRGEPLSRAEAYDRALAISLEATGRGNKLMFIGNGGSAAIAGHMAIDFTKNGGMPALCFNDGAALTCLGNDFGYQEVFARQIGFHARPRDVLYAISSSGRSPNMLRAVEEARRLDCPVITLSGFRADNPLRTLGDLNFYVALEEYGLVEVAHTALIHAVVDLKIGRALRVRP